MSEAFDIVWKFGVFFATAYAALFFAGWGWETGRSLATLHKQVCVICLRDIKRLNAAVKTKHDSRKQ